ncbi:MAG TPA: KR domain-containing protein, partial [Thermoanaerobaculia bacterium]
AAALARARERFGGLHGIVHAAGVPAGGLLARKPAAEAARVLAPKVAGARVAFAVAAEAGADFLLLCSSLASLLGGPGQADHCAANAFLDAFAWAACRGADAGGPRVVAVNWPAWREVGQAAEAAVPDQLARWRRQSLADGLAPAEGADACGRILGTRLRQVIVSPVPLGVLVAEGREFVAAGLEERLGRLGAPPAGHPRPLLSNPYTAPRSPLEAAIAEVWQQLLGIAAIGVEDDFLALGGHSLLATQVMSRLRERLGLEIPLRALFEAPTVAGLARAVGERLAAAADPRQLAAALAELEGISDEQAAARLAATEPSPAGEASS